VKAMKKWKQINEIGAILLSFAVVMVAIVMAQAKMAKVAQVHKTTQAGDYNILGPYTHENLTVFLIQSKNDLSGKNFLTLQEAIEQKKVIVHETGQVNELAIENISQDEVYIQSGDIVKGGKQDRVLAFDFIVPSKSGKVSIASFCVEQQRWQQRRGEEVVRFSSSNDQLATKELKLAAKQKADQGEVWRSVASTQRKLSDNVGESVKSETSASSLQLSIENKKVQKATDNYVTGLSNIIQGKRNIIGYAFAINGKLNSADTYASSALFKKLWPKLLKASAIEAVSEMEKGKRFTPARAEDVKSCLLDVEQGRASEKEITKRVKMITQETERNLLFETRDQSKGGAWVHRNYITK
jgi:hypothetical protein